MHDYQFMKRPYPQPPSQPYYPFGSYDDYLHHELSGFADELGNELLKANKNIAKNTLDQIKVQIYTALQKELDKVRGKTVEFLRYEIKSKLPLIKKAIQAEGPNLSKKGLVGLENLIRSAIGIKPIAEDTETPADTKSTQMVAPDGSKVANPIQKPSNFLVDLMPNMNVKAADLSILNPRTIASQILTPDIIEEFKENTLVPLKEVAKQDVLPPIKKKAKIAGSLLFGGGFLLGGLMTWGLISISQKRKKKVNASFRN